MALGAALSGEASRNFRQLLAVGCESAGSRLDLSAVRTLARSAETSAGPTARYRAGDGPRTGFAGSVRASTKGRLPGGIPTLKASNRPDADSQRRVSPIKNRGIKNSTRLGAEPADVYPRHDSYSRRRRRAAGGASGFPVVSARHKGFVASTRTPAARSSRPVAIAGQRRGRARCLARVAYSRFSQATIVYSPFTRGVRT